MAMSPCLVGGGLDVAPRAVDVDSPAHADAEELKDFIQRGAVGEVELPGLCGFLELAALGGLAGQEGVPVEEGAVGGGEPLHLVEVEGARSPAYW